MFTSLSDVLLAVVRATAALSLSAGIVWGLIRWFKPASPRLQQAAWLLVLLQGIVLLRFPVEVPWGTADVAIAIKSASAETPSLALDFNRLADPQPRSPSSLQPASVPFAWQPVVFGLWLAGCGATMAWWAIVYLRVARRDTHRQASTTDWDSEWQRLLDRNGVTAPIHLRVTDETGPMLVWRPGGPEVLVPRTLWEGLSSPQRLAILRHELAHFQHGDLWKGALIRLLALPHWFNPLAWWVVKNLDECAEWLCDDKAIGLDRDSATVYADVLLRLGTETKRVCGPATAIRGGRLHRRICRVLSRETTERSFMNKLVLTALPLALLAAHFVRVQLVAAPAARGSADTSKKSSPDAAQARTQNARALPPPVTNPDREARAYRTLEKPTNVEFSDLALVDGVQYFSEYHNFPIRIDAAALKAAKVSVVTPVTLNMEGVPFRRILNRLLLPLELDWYAEGPGLLVTTRHATRQRLEGFLKYELQIIDSLCELTEAQTQKLQLAGTGDIQRLSDAIQEFKAKMQLVADDEKKVAELLAEIDPLHQRVETGPFGKDSLFRKTLDTVLTPAQLVTYKPIQEVLQADGRVATVQRGRDVILSVGLNQTPFADDGLAQLKKLKILGSLRIDMTKVTDAGLVHLKELTNLRELGLFGTHITDGGLVHLQGMTNLQMLVIGGTTIADVGLAHLKGLTNLQNLSLNYLEMTDAGLAHLKGLTNLQGLDLGGTKVTDAGLVQLKMLTNLDQLELFQTPVTDDGLVHLKILTNLQRLGLQRTLVTDAGLVHLQGLPNLQRLDLGGTQVTDDGLSIIKEMAGLQTLNLSNSKVTDAGYADLMKTLPKLTFGY